MHSIIAANIAVIFTNLIGMMVTMNSRVVPRGSWVDKHFGWSIAILDSIVWVSIVLLSWGQV